LTGITTATSAILNSVFSPVLSVVSAVTQISANIMLFTINAVTIAANYANNRGHKTFPVRASIWQPDGYARGFENGFITRQTLFESWRFGFWNIAQNGCGPIAVFNVLNYYGRLNNGSVLTDEPTAITLFANIIRDFEVFFGTNAFGFLGTNPIHISPYLTARGLKTNTFVQQSSMNTAMNNAAVGTAMIVMYYIQGNDGGLQVHYITFIKEANGTFRQYNPVSDVNVSSLNQYIANTAAVADTRDAGFVQGWIVTR
jgi:hypothetical protein